MSYTITKTVSDADFETVEARTRDALSESGFGVLTEIDVSATMKKKIDKDVPPYLILGACNPNMAYQAIGIEPKIGAMLPCNVIVRESGNGVTVSAVDPVASMQAVDNDKLHSVAGEVRSMLETVVKAI